MRFPAKCARTLPLVIPGLAWLLPGIHLDGRDKFGHDV